jgi:hypothetical protein
VIGAEGVDHLVVEVRAVVCHSVFLSVSSFFGLVVGPTASCAPLSARG